MISNNYLTIIPKTKIQIGVFHMSETFLNAQVTKKEVGDALEFHVSQKDFDGIYDERGITKDVRKQIKDVENEVTTASVNFLKDKVIESKGKTCAIILGSGDGRTKVVTKGQSEVRIPGEKGAAPEFKTVYGQTSISVSKKIPGAIKNSTLADARAEIEKALG